MVMEYGKTCEVHHSCLQNSRAELDLTGLLLSPTCQDRVNTLQVQDPMANLTGLPLLWN
jgi:hypothetical protein